MTEPYRNNDDKHQHYSTNEKKKVDWEEKNTEKNDKM